MLTGRGRFVDDVRRERMLHARFVRSTVAHGTLIGVGVEAARALAGVAAVWTAADLSLPDLVPPRGAPGVKAPPLDASGANVPPRNAPSPELPRPILAGEVVRFAGEAVALVIAENPYVAEDAAGLVDLEIDPLPVLATPDSATTADAPRIHQHTDNVVFEASMDHGDVDEAFRGAHAVVELELTSPRQTALPMEPRGMVAEPSGEGVRVWASTQVPHILRRALSELLDLPLDAVQVICPDVGGGFGLKAHVYPEDVAVAAAALRLGRPVKWIEDRSDNLAAACHARDQRVRARAAADREGRLTAVEVDITCDVGAYGVYAHGHVVEAIGTPSMVPGPYRLGAYRYRSRAVATNKCPEGAYRGVGLPVSTLVHERVMDALARELSMDPVEIRRRNLITSAEMPWITPTGQRYDSGDYAQALELAAEAIGWAELEAAQAKARAQGRLIGGSVCCWVEYTAVNGRVFSGRGMRGLKGFDEAFVVLDPAGTAQVWTTLPSAGQGLMTTFAQIAADGLRLPLAAVTVRSVDTNVGGLEGTGTFASRSAVSGGGAIEVAAAEVRRRLIEDAATYLEAAEADLELGDGRITVSGVPGPSVAVGELVAAADTERYQVSGRFDPPEVTYPYGAHACMVEIDPDTGQVRILRYVVVDDCGLVVNPLVVEGQVHGAVAQGIAGALYESIVYDDNGQLQTGSLMDYLVPTASEMPRFELAHVAESAMGPGLGAKGVGESGTLAPGPVLAAAVESALGAPCTSLPIQPEWVQHWAQERLLATAMEVVARG